MKFFLASEIKHPNSMRDLEKFISGFEGKKIAYIPTASNGEDGYGYWKESSSYKTVTDTKAVVTPVVLEEFRSNKVIDVLKQNDIIWFAGGFWGYLMYWISVCEIDLHIRELLDSGKVYVGSSAGSNITGKSLEIAEWFRYDLKEWGIERGGSKYEGLGLVDFDIYPHYSEELNDWIKSHYKGNKMYLLKNGEAITVDDGKITVTRRRKDYHKMKQVDICVFGDSVTYAGYIKNSWANQLRWYLESKEDAEYHLFNLGINANTTTDILKRFDIEAAARTPNVIVFASGVNDSAYLLDSKEPITDFEVFKENIKLLINKAQTYTKDITFIGLALGDDSLLKPYPESSRGKSYDIERVKQYDQAINEIAGNNACKYIALFKNLEFTDFSDGLHPNECGHKKMYEVIREYFK